MTFRHWCDAWSFFWSLHVWQAFACASWLQSLLEPQCSAGNAWPLRALRRTSLTILCHITPWGLLLWWCWDWHAKARRTAKTTSEPNARKRQSNPRQLGTKNGKINIVSDIRHARPRTLHIKGTLVSTTSSSSSSYKEWQAREVTTGKQVWSY